MSKDYSAKKTVLLIEDDPMFRLRMAQILREVDARVVGIHSPIESLPDGVTEDTIDMVVLDLHTEGHDPEQGYAAMVARFPSKLFIVCSSAPDRCPEAALTNVRCLGIVDKVGSSFREALINKTVAVTPSNAAASTTTAPQKIMVTTDVTEAFNRILNKLDEFTG